MEEGRTYTVAIALWIPVVFSKRREEERDRTSCCKDLLGRNGRMYESSLSKKRREGGKVGCIDIGSSKRREEKYTAEGLIESKKTKGGGNAAEGLLASKPRLGTRVTAKKKEGGGEERDLGQSQGSLREKKGYYEEKHTSWSLGFGGEYKKGPCMSE